jgi:uncharacterized membrane protein YbhN (UPF0104 family)
MDINAGNAIPENQYAQRLEKLSFWLGAAAIPSTFISPVIAPFLLGSMAIIFAVLSKGGNLRFSRRSRTAALLGAAAIIINIVYLVITFVMMKELLSDPAGRKQLSDTLYRRYGLTLDELLPQIPGLE